MDEYIEVFGTVTSVIYQNEENGYTVLRMDTDEGEMTVVGCMPYCSPGESISVTGRMTRHQSYGLQLKAEVVERSLPAGEEHVYEYLASGVIQGVGPATARLIVERFKDKALEVIGETPERLAEIRGISHSKALKIGSVFRRREGVRRLMEFLTYYDISPKYAVQIYKCYGDESISAIREDPYVLSDTYFGVDFLQVDAMALSLGVDPEADERVRAAVKYELEYNLNNGHSFIAEPKLAAATARLIDVDAELAERGISSLCEREELVKQEVCGVSACYLARLYEAEFFEHFIPPFGFCYLAVGYCLYPAVESSITAHW